MQISNVNIWLGPYFTMKEFFTKDKNYTSETHEFDERLIEAVQYVREITDQPIKINSTFRSEEYNKLVGGAPNSYHKKGRAVDWTFVNDKIMMVKQFKKMYYDPDSNFKSNLHNLGINGVIFYETFIHFDTRTIPYLNDTTKEKEISGIMIGLGFLLLKSIM